MQRRHRGALHRRQEPSIAQCLRHTFATANLLKGQDIRSVAALLAHSSVNTTMLYTGSRRCAWHEPLRKANRPPSRQGN
ncbi:tyrosine-type recombinase/integrase [Massilia niastensis]|uniref:tyrosine-type recombinase/integrase n=1 Tax=Massilia niastensis TaxID=544911 RepID=UPI000A04EB12